MITQLFTQLFTRCINLIRGPVDDYERTVSTDVYWQTGTDRYIVTDFDNFNQQADYLKAHPNFKLIIEGHCDRSEVPNMESAIMLAERRAQAHRAVLHYQCGIELDRLMIVSYGYQRPIFQPAYSDFERRVNGRTHTGLR